MLDMVEFKKLAKALVVIEKATADSVQAGHTIPWFAVEIWLFTLGISVSGVATLKTLVQGSPLLRFSEDGQEITLRRVHEVA